MLMFHKFMSYFNFKSVEAPKPKRVVKILIDRLFLIFRYRSLYANSKTQDTQIFKD